MLRCMRTTLTLEPDVAARIEQRRRESRRPLKAEVNRLLRLGLEHDGEAGRAAPASRYRVEPFAVGELLVDVDDVTAALEIAESSSS
jgi:hypothetical protein